MEGEASTSTSIDQIKSDSDSLVQIKQEVVNEDLPKKDGNDDDEENEGEEINNYFKCELCGFEEKYTYFGLEPPFAEHVFFHECYYVIEDPFIAPKQGEFLILGANCSKCSKLVCKDPKCSFFYERTYCVNCAKTSGDLPQQVLEKLNKIIAQ